MIVSKIPFCLLVSAIFIVVLICPANSEPNTNIQQPKNNIAGSNNQINHFEKLMEIIRTGNAYQRARSIPSLARLDHPEVVPVLINLMKDENSQVRVYAAHQLNRLADNRSTDAIVAALRDDNENVRNYAAQTLSKIGSSEHVPALVESVINNLPDPQDPQKDWSMRATLEAIGKLSRNAPPRIINLLGRVTGEEQVHKDMWWFYEGVAICLERIGDKSVYSELKRVDNILSNGKQDYKAWYAIRKALGSVAPKKDPFKRPAADILYSQRPFKITQEGIRKRWILPLAELGEGAIDDLAWAIKFEGEQDRERKDIAIQALGEIGGEKAAKVLREYIYFISSRLTDPAMDMPMMAEMEGLSDTNRDQHRWRRRHSYPFRLALLALLKAEPTEETAEEIIDLLPILDMEQEYYLYDISIVSHKKIPTDIKILFYKEILMDPPRERQMRLNVYKAAKLLGEIGGKESGDALSEALLKSENSEARNVAAIALGSIQGYDALQTLIKASKGKKASVAALAEAMGKINDPRTLPVLEYMEGREKLSEMDRLWLAAALARFGKDYEKNAEIVRNGLPASYEPMTLLDDSETINILINEIKSGPIFGQAIKTLEAIGSREALSALHGLIEQEKIPSPQRHREIASVAARIADRLEMDSRNYYNDVATVSKEVLDWFEIHQRPQPRPEDRSSLKVVEHNGVLARKLWIAEATRRLDLAAKERKESHESHIPEQAVTAIRPIYDSELIPVLERIAKESKSTVEFHGKYKIVKFYYVRSKAAEILTEKTAQQYTFIDVDGRSHHGGWSPSQEQ